PVLSLHLRSQPHLLHKVPSTRDTTTGRGTKGLRNKITHQAAHQNPHLPKCLPSQLVSVMLVFSVMLSAARSSVRCRSSPCPPSWIAVQEKCYFFSEEKTTQAESIKQCAESGSALATVTERQETLQVCTRESGTSYLSHPVIHGGLGIPFAGFKSGRAVPVRCSLVEFPP
uniref:C-type lectin domain-containing protein n=1 Tax=Leptobrachium leishanense TaxID=445787 RepID=A0A8C5QKR7_9ANUR